MKKIITYAFAGLLGFAACETTMGMNDFEIYSRVRKNDSNTWSISQQRDEDGNTVLHIQAQRGDIKLMRMTLSFPYIMAEDINSVNDDKCTPLHLAVENGNTGIVKMLLSRPEIDVNVFDISEHTPLDTAAELGNPEIVRLLISHNGTDLNMTNESNGNALLFAVDKSDASQLDVETALMLIQDRRVDVNCKLAFIMAIFHQNMTIIKAFLERPDLDLSGSYSGNVITEALSTGNLEILSLLLSDTKYDAKARAVALRSIAEHYTNNWNEELVLMVLNDPRIDPNGTSTPENWCPPLIHFALAYEKNLKLFKLILQNLKIDLNKKFSPTMMGYEVERVFDKIERVSPFEFLIGKFNDVGEFEIKNSMEWLSKLFLFRKMASEEAIPALDILLQWASKEYPDLVKSELWNSIIDIAYGNKSELALFKLLISNNENFNHCYRRETFRYDFLKSLLTKLAFFKEFAPTQAELQQWVIEQYPQFATSEAWQQVLDTLYGPQQD